LTRAAADQVLRWLLLSTVVGVVVIVILAIVISDQRGLLLAVGGIYLITSLAAYFTVRRNLEREFARQRRRDSEGA
jgi:drug/metabolite transporter superfamily protein YnfA